MVFEFPDGTEVQLSLQSSETPPIRYHICRLKKVPLIPTFRLEFYNPYLHKWQEKRDGCGFRYLATILLLYAKLDRGTAYIGNKRGERVDLSEFQKQMKKTPLKLA